jgi:hypothetical protein
MNQPHQPTNRGAATQEVLKPILYADIFDYPLTFDEIYKFLEFKASPEEVESMLAEALARREIIVVDGYYSLAHKPHLVAKRQERWQASQTLWPKAVFYGRWIASLPFIRLVSVTGSLAVDNPRDGVDDIDYLIVTSPKRLWLCRALIILMVKFGNRRGVYLCPNYILTENVLYFEENNLFVAREMLQMIPLYGRQFYLKMRQLNDWVINYLPQGAGLNLHRVDDRLSTGQCTLKKMGEIILGGFIGDALEKILQKIQITKHMNRAKKVGALDKVIFTADLCKGHYDGHNQKTMQAYQQRVQNHTAAPGPLSSFNGTVKNLE